MMVEVVAHRSDKTAEMVVVDNIPSAAAAAATAAAARMQTLLLHHLLLTVECHHVVEIVAAASAWVVCNHPSERVLFVAATGSYHRHFHQHHDLSHHLCRSA